MSENILIYHHQNVSFIIHIAINDITKVHFFRSLSYSLSSAYVSVYMRQAVYTKAFIFYTWWWKKEERRRKKKKIMFVLEIVRQFSQFLSFTIVSFCTLTHTQICILTMATFQLILIMVLFWCQWIEKAHSSQYERASESMERGEVKQSSHVEWYNKQLVIT